MKKRLVFVIESLQVGGSEKSLVSLLQQLDPEAFSIDLLVFHRGGLFEKQVPKTVNLIIRKFPMLTVLERVRYKVSRLLREEEVNAQQLLWPIIKHKIKPESEKYDVAIAYSQGFASYYTANFIEAPVKYSWLNVDYIQAKYKYNLDASIYQKFKAIVCVSPQVVDGIEQAMQGIGEPVPTILLPDLVAEREIREQANETIDFPRTKSKFQLLTVARLKEEKGLLMALDACQILLTKGYEITWSIVGEGTQRPKLEAQIKSKNLEQNFQLLGAFDNPYAYMKACDVYVQTSFYEGLGLTLIEAAVLGKPIITTDFPTAYNVIEDKVTGLIVEMNANAIAEAIQKLLESEKLRAEFSRNIAQKFKNPSFNSMEIFKHLID